MQKLLILLLFTLATSTSYLTFAHFDRSTGQNCLIEGEKVMNYLFLEDKVFDIVTHCTQNGTNCVEIAENAIKETELALLALKHDLEGCQTALTNEQKASFLLHPPFVGI